MLKVLIVDDENYICQLIKSLIHWEELNLELIGTANSGTEALNMIISLKPDIVISDIKMPEMDGIELITKVQEANIDSNFIMISGHRNFEYAYEALKSNVKDYILKPIKEEELNNSLHKIALEINERAETKTATETLNDKLSHSVLKLNDYFITDTVNNKKMESIEYIKNTYSITLSPTLFNFLIIKVDTGNAKTRRPYPYIVYQEIRNHCIELLNPICSNVILVEKKIGLIVFVNYEHNYDTTFEKTLKQLLKACTRSISKFANYSVTICSGIQTSDIKTLPDVYTETKLCLYSRVILGNNKIIDAEDIKSLNTNVSDILTPSIIHSLDNTFETLNTKQYAETINHIFSKSYKEYHPSIHYLICERIISIFNFAMEKYKLRIPNGNYLFEQIKDWLISATHTVEMKDIIYHSINDVLESNLTLRSEQGRNSIVIAKEYISNHYVEPIRLEDVAEAVHLSPSYFSTLFKKETSENFVDYLTRFRMERAKELLRNTNDTISSIACSVGISDSRYFNKLFKKNVGLNPSVYRKLYR